MLKRVTLKCISLAMMLACALCLVLVGCGGAGAKLSEADFVGTWKLESGESGDETLAAEDIELMESLDMYWLVQFEEGGAGSMDALGEVFDFEWKIDGAKATTEIDGDTMDFTLEDKKLIATSTDSTMTFIKADDLADQIETDRNARVDLGDDEEDDDAIRNEIDPVVMADDDICKIVFVAEGTDEWGDTGYYVTIENKSDQSLQFYSDDDRTSIDGTMCIGWLGETVMAGANAETFFYFDNSVVGSLDDLKNVKTAVTVSDSEWNDVADYEVEIP